MNLTNIVFLISMSQKKPKAYIYPPEQRNDGKPNIYIVHFVKWCGEYFDFVNKGLSPHTGIFDILKYHNQIDVLFLNWPEEVPERKGGTLQSVFYFFIIWYLKLRGVTICWTLHNKVSHVKGHYLIKQLLRKFSARNADYIITHAKDGLEVIKSLTPESNIKIKFFHHPVLHEIELKKSEIKYDVLIWGLVSPYKGVDKFLEFIRHENLADLKVMIAGRIEGSEYRNEILSYKNENIFISDRFIPEKELEELISSSRIVLFTYLDYSILSSAALMDSIRYFPIIVGPSSGAFKDLKEEGLIYTYSDYHELKTLLLNSKVLNPDRKKIKEFINNNSWADFSRKLSDFIKIKA